MQKPFTLGVFIMLIGSSLFGATITLQQGVGEYNGCEDSYIESENVDGYNGFGANHGDSQIIAAAKTRYASW